MHLVLPNDSPEKDAGYDIKRFLFATGANMSKKELDKAYDRDRIRNLAKFLGKDEDAVPSWYSWAPERGHRISGI